MNRYARDLLNCAIVWRDASLCTCDSSFKRRCRRNMRDCALAWREACREEQE